MITANTDNTNSSRMIFKSDWQGSLLQNVVLSIVVGFAFYYSARLGHLFLSFPPDYISVFWPPNTFMLAALVFVHPRRWWIYFTAMLFAYLLAAGNAGFSIQKTTIFFIANVAEVLIAVAAFRYFLNEPPRFVMLREIIVFLVFAILAANMASASIASIVTLAEPDISYWSAWRVWFMSDGLAHLAVTPVLLIAISSLKDRSWIVSPLRYAEAGALTAGLITVSLIVFGGQAGSQGNLPAMVYTPLPFLLWASIRFGPWGASSAILFITIFSVWNTAHGHGPFITMVPADNVFSLQLFMMVISLPIMILSALIQERQKADAELLESKNLLSTLISTIPDLVWLKDPNGVYLACNAAIARLYGARPEQIIGKTDYDFADAELADFFRQKDKEAMEAGMPRINEELVSFADDGHKALLETIKAPMYAFDGSITGVLGIARDITGRKHTENELKARTEDLEDSKRNLEAEIVERKKAEAAIEIERRRLFSLLDTLPAFVYLQAPDYSIRFANKYYVEHFGETEGKPCYNSLWGRSEPCEICPTFKVFKTKEPQQWEWDSAPDGLTYDIIDHPFTDTDGTELVFELGVDITKRKKFEEQLKESEERYKSMFQNNHSVMLLIDPTTTKIVDANPAALSFYGYDYEQITNMRISEINTLSASEVHAEMAKAKQEQRWHFFFKHRLKDKSERDVEVFSGPLKMHGRELLYSIVHDITDRKKAENQVKASLAEKVVLLREIHHRVKNNFQVIISLLKIQSRHIKDQSLRDTFMDSQNRIRSMALVHERLYMSNDLSNIRSAEYISTLVNGLKRSYTTHSGIDLQADVADIKLPVDTAIACGLIINELISNSLKHAFHEMREGTILISFHSSGNELECELIIMDNGCGLPEDIELGKVKSMGLSLVNSLSTRQLSGKVEITRDAGTEFKISFRTAPEDNTKATSELEGR